MKSLILKLKIIFYPEDKISVWLDVSKKIIKKGSGQINDRILLTTGRDVKVTGRRN
jgi:hypothetical protein